MAAELEQILQKLLIPDSHAIHQATLELKTAFSKPDIVPALVHVLQGSTDATIRQYASILLRRRIVKQWNKLKAEDKAAQHDNGISSVRSGLKLVLLEAVTKEQVAFVRKSICQVIGLVGRHELEENTWPELMAFIAQLVRSVEPAEKELGFLLLSSLCELAGEQLQRYYQELFQVFTEGLADAACRQNAFHTIKAITSLVPFLGSDEEVLLKPMLQQILDVIKLLLQEDEDKASEALDIFDALTQIEVPIVAPFIRPLMEFCMQVVALEQLSDQLRTKALYLICWGCRRKSKSIEKADLLTPLLELLLKMMSRDDIEDDEDDDDEEAADDSQGSSCGSPIILKKKPQQNNNAEMNSLSSVAGQALDLLALHLPPNRLIPTLMELLKPRFASANEFERKAAFIALGELGEGCADFIRNKYLETAVTTALGGLSDKSTVARNGALFALGQLSEHVQPEIGKMHAKVVPALLSLMGIVVNDPEAKTQHRGTLTKVFYALEEFTEGLEKDTVVTYIPQLMEAYNHVLNNSKDSHTSELSISAIGALVSSAQEEMGEHFGTIMAHLKVFFSQPLTLDSLDVHSQAVDTLGCLARNIGRDKFLPFADECMDFGIKLIGECDDPDLRRCTYGLFASLSVVLKEEMSKYLPIIHPKMIESLKSAEGIIEEFDTEDPAFLLEDEEEKFDDLLNNTEEDIAEEDEGVGMTVLNSYMEEKEDSANCFAEIAENVGLAIHPYIEEIFSEITALADFPHCNVRKAVLTASCRLCVVVRKQARSHPEVDCSAVLQAFVSKAVPMAISALREDDDRYAVIATLEVLTDLLKELRAEAFTDSKQADDLALAVLDIFRGKVSCQQFVDDEDGASTGGDEESSQAELDQMLVEKSGDLLPALAQATGGERFKPYFVGFLIEIKKRTKKHCLVSERSFAAGSIAETVQAMGIHVSEFASTIAPLLVQLLSDADDEVRSNAAFAIGVLIEAASAHMQSFMEGILRTFGELLKQCPPPLVKDNICGALARCVNTCAENAPEVGQIVLVIAQCLPVQEDKRENETTMKCLVRLYARNSTIVLPYLEKILPCFIDSIRDPNSGLEPDTKNNLREVLTDIQTKYAEPFQLCLNQLNVPNNFLHMVT